MIKSDSCSARSLATSESMTGSAPYARGWIAIEQLGPYGAKALTESHLPTEIGERLEQLAAEHDIRPELIRHVGRHADTHAIQQPRKVYLACSVPGSVAMASMTITDPAELLSINFAALAVGDMADVHPDAELTDETVLLICTHAKRDVCCATLGRPLAEALASGSDVPSAIWECSHLGGHRFAPTAVQLPHGWVHGRLDLSTATAVIDLARAGQVSLAAVRGRSSLTASEQVADIEFRALNASNGIDATRVRSLDSGVIEVSDSRTARSARVFQSVLDAERPESCGKNVSQVTALTLSWL